MEKCTCNCSTRILLIDDNPSTSTRLVHLFAMLGCDIVSLSPHQSLETIRQNDLFHLVLINQATSTNWVPSCVQIFKFNIPVISYNPAHLLHDFKMSELLFSKEAGDEGWMFHSEFFRLVESVKYKKDTSD